MVRVMVDRPPIWVGAGTQEPCKLRILQQAEKQRRTAVSLLTLSCPRRRSFNRRTSHLNTARRRLISPQSSARTPQRPAAMDAAPTAPTGRYGRRADARPASVGRLSGLSGRCRPRCCRSGPLHAPHKQRQTTVEVAGFGQVPTTCLLLLLLLFLVLFLF